MCYDTHNIVRNLRSTWRRFLEALELARHIVDVVEDRKAEDIVLLDLRPDTVIADFFVLCNGNSDRQIRALSEYVTEDVKERFGFKPYSSEGTPESGWVLMDYGSVVLHIFDEDTRDYYDLEGLWHEVAQVLLSIQ